MGCQTCHVLWGAIRAGMREAGCTQAELARRAGLSRGYLSRYLRGQRSLSLEAADRLLVALDLKIAVRPRRSRRSRPRPALAQASTAELDVTADGQDLPQDSNTETAP